MSGNLACVFRASQVGGLRPCSSASSADFQPTNTVADAPTWQGLLTQSAGNGEVNCRAGTAAIASPVTCPSLSTMRMLAAFVAISSIAQPNPATDPFSAILNADSPATGVTGTVQTTPVVGSRTLIVTGFVPVVGRPIMVRHSVSASIYVPTAVAGAGPYTVTLDRAIVFPWVATDPVEELASLTHDIRIDGRGATFKGLGNQAIEIARTLRVRVSDLHFDPSSGVPSGAAFGLDLGCREAVFEDMTANLNGAVGAQNGFYFQSHERSVMSRVAGLKCPVGASLLDCYASGLDDVWTTECQYGAVIGSLALDGVASLGNFDCWVKGGGDIGSAVGLFVFASRRLTVEGYVARKCSTYGFLVQVGAHGEPVDATTFLGASAPDCAIGAFVGAGVTNTTFYGFDCTGATTYGLQCQADVEVFGVTARASNMSAVVYLQGPGRSRASGVLADNAKPGGYGVISTTTADVRDSNLKMTGGGGCIAYYVAGGAMYLEGCATTGSTAGSIGLKVSAGTSATIGPNCDLSACEFPVSVDAGGLLYMVPARGDTTVAMADAAKTLTWAQYTRGIIKCTGAMTADRAVTFPPIIGHVWTVNNATTGGGSHNIVATGPSGTTINCAPGISRVYWDGTNMVAA